MCRVVTATPRGGQKLGPVRQVSTVGQEDVLRLLRDNGPATCKDIATVYPGASITAIERIMNVLNRHGEVRVVGKDHTNARIWEAVDG